jgi:hypothetical protein
MTHAYPAWEFSADSDLLKLQRLQNRVLRTTGNLTRRTRTGALHLTLQIPYLYYYYYYYYYLTKICRKQAEVIQTHDNMNLQNRGKSEAQHRKYKRHKLGDG